jgi:hypothetical protein
MVVVTKNISAAVYIDLLVNYLLQSIESMFGDHQTFFIFQQNNAPAHTANATCQWMEDNEIHTADCPSQGPDLIIIENVWGEITRVIARQCPDYRQELIYLMLQIRNSLSLEYIQSLYHSIHRRLRATIHNTGYPTRY